MEETMKIDFYLLDTDGEETRVTKTLKCDEYDRCNLEGLFEEFKYFLKAMSFDSDYVDFQLQHLDWHRVGWGEEEKYLENGETVLISRDDKCEAYVYDDGFPRDTTHWCYLPLGYKDKI